MALTKVLFNLAQRGVEPAMKLFKGKTLLSFNLGEKQLVQLFDESGKLSKFKIYGKNGFWDSPTIKKGTKIYDDHAYYPSVTTTTVKKQAKYPFLTPERTEVFRAEPFPDSKSIEIKKTGGAYGDEVTKISSSKISEGWYIGDIEKTGGLDAGKRSFDTSRTHEKLNNWANQYNDDFIPLNTQYEDDYARMMRQMEEDNQRIIEQQRRDEDDFLTLFGIGGGLDGLI